MTSLFSRQIQTPFSLNFAEVSKLHMTSLLFKKLQNNILVVLVMVPFYFQTIYTRLA